MFEKVPGPSQAEIVEAANRLIAAARQNGGQVRFVRGTTAEDEKEWTLMNQAGEWLEQQNRGRMTLCSTGSFDFIVH